jgi:flagellar motility protein MotE (MotC chaperone)
MPNWWFNDNALGCPAALRKICQSSSGSANLTRASATDPSDRNEFGHRTKGRVSFWQRVCHLRSGYDQSGRTPMTNLQFILHTTRIVVTLGYVLTPVAGLRAEQKKSDAARPAQSSSLGSDIDQFCANIAAIAGDARIAWQTSKLRELEAEVNQRIGELDSKRAQLVEWARKRDEALKKADDAVIAIYAQLKPDAAAQHLSAMEDAMAAAIIAKLPPRTASAILNEMEPARAAQLTRGMVSQEEKKS